MIKLTKKSVPVLLLVIMAISAGCIKKVDDNSVPNIPQSTPTSKDFDESIDIIIKQASTWQKLVKDGRYNEAKGNLAKVDIEVKRAKGVLDSIPHGQRKEGQSKQLEIAKRISSQEKWVLHRWRTGRTPDTSGHRALLNRLKQLRK